MNTQLSGTQVAGCLNPVRGVRDEQRRKGIAPVDYAKKNLQFIRDIEKRQQHEKAAATQAAQSKPPPFKLQQFKDVSPKVRTLVQESSPSPNQQTSPTHSATSTTRPTFKFLKKGQRRSTEAKKDSSARKPRAKLKEAVPRRNDLNKLAPRSKRDYISSNFREAKESRTPTRQSPDMQATGSKHKEFGQVPKYLVKQKLEQAKKDVALREAEAMGAVPEGMVVLKEEDRLRTLATLQESMEETKRELQKAPLRIETAGQKRRMKELEDKLNETEEAIKIFSKERVFVYEE